MITQALQIFRRRPLALVEGDVLPAVFVIDSGMRAGREVIASWNPAVCVQVLGGASRAADPSVRASIEHGIDVQGAKSIVVCAEGARGPDAGETREGLVGACQALLEDPVLGPRIQSGDVALEALWFDTSEGDLFRWIRAERRLELLADSGLMQLMAELCSRS